MFFTAGITAKVGGAVARGLPGAGREVRALVGDGARATEWSDRGVELHEGDLTDVDFLAVALEGVEVAFLMQPTPFGASPGFPEARALNASIMEALRRARPPRLVVLSSVGSEQSSGLGNITRTHMLEEDLAHVTVPIALVRAGGFMENTLASLGRAAEAGVFDSFCQPVDRAVPMIAAQDIGAEVARLVTGAPWEGRRIVELGSPATANDIAAAMGEALGVMGPPPDHAANWAEMQDGYNSGWIASGRPGTKAVAGTTTPAQVFAQAHPGHGRG